MLPYQKFRVIHPVPTMRESSEELLAMRRLAGADAFDEVWDGEVVMASGPDFDHQRLEFWLAIWLQTHRVPKAEGRFDESASRAVLP